MATVNQALDAARLLAEWYDRIAPGTQYDGWVAFRVLGVTSGGTINVDRGTMTISYDRPRLEALQAAWRTATEYVNGSAERWPVWRIHDWRVAIPPLVEAVRAKSGSMPDAEFAKFIEEVEENERQRQAAAAVAATAAGKSIEIPGGATATKAKAGLVVVGVVAGVALLARALKGKKKSSG